MRKPVKQAGRDIFLSHRSVDKEFVRKLAGDIQHESGKTGRSLAVWLDESEIPIGGSIPGHIEKGLETSRFFAAVMTPAYFASESGWTDAEWHSALNQDPDNRRARFIPILVADCPRIPFLLRQLRAIDFRGSAYRSALKQLIAVLQGAGPGTPIVHRGQLITPEGRLDTSQMIAARATVLGAPASALERLQCNLLPIERLPPRVYVAPLLPALVKVKRGKRSGSDLPKKSSLIELVKRKQLEAGTPIFTPAFRMYEHNIISFHDLTDPEGALATLVDDGAADSFTIREFMREEEYRKVTISLLNMALHRHAYHCGLAGDPHRSDRFHFPPKGEQPNVITWRPLRRTASRTVAKPLKRDGVVTSWVHLAAHLRMLYLADKLYLQIEPTWLLTKDGQEVRTGPDVGKLLVRWIGGERNLQVLYHIRLWTQWLRRRRPGPISVRAGDQTLDISTFPAFCEVPFGIEGDHKDLLNALDAEAQILGDEEDALIETAVEAGEELDPEASWSEDEPQEEELVSIDEDDDATTSEQHDD
jgi:TIR domain